MAGVAGAYISMIQIMRPHGAKVSRLRRWLALALIHLPWRPLRVMVARAFGLA